MSFQSWFSATTSSEAPARTSRPAMTPDPELVWRQLVKRRALVVVALLAAWGVVIQARLVQVQVFMHEEYATRAANQHDRRITLPAKRGDILDRHGRLLAYSTDGRMVYADPSMIDDPERAVGQVCGVLACDRAERQELASQLGRSEKRYVVIRSARNLLPDQAASLAALEEPWLGLTTESLRSYPGRTLASQVLGFVGADGQGRSGVEGQFDDLIAGRPGLAEVQVDANKRALKARIAQPATAGATIELTIDQSLQYVAERELAAGVRKMNAEGGTAIVMEAMTGEVLALANYPDFNPNDYQASPASTWRNRATQDVYEPGSTLKIVTASAALEEHLFDPASIIDINYGQMSIPGRGRPIIDDHPGPTLMSFEDVIVKSSNVGAVKIGLRVGPERLTLYARRFGLGQVLSPDFAGQSRGLFFEPSQLNQVALASVAMGYNISVTPLQMVTAMSVIANGGQLVEPRLVRAVYRDGAREPVEPTVLRQAISPETARTMVSFLENVVSRGTAKAASLSRYQAAGKTGTSKKAIPGGYSETDRNSSFAGFVPSRDPKFVILVVIDTPRTGIVYGGAVAAPVFKGIAEAALRLYGVTPTINPDPPIVVPGRRADVAVTHASVRTPAASAASDSVVAPGSMPDVRGLSAREATVVLHRVGLEARIVGSGHVTAQMPQAGEPLPEAGWVALELSRRNVEPTGPGGGR